MGLTSWGPTSFILPMTLTFDPRPIFSQMGHLGHEGDRIKECGWLGSICNLYRKKTLRVHALGREASSRRVCGRDSQLLPTSATQLVPWVPDHH